MTGIEEGVVEAAVGSGTAVRDDRVWRNGRAAER